MSNKQTKLVLTKDAPDEVEISLGMEFQQNFKRSEEPFEVEEKYADTLFRSYDFFTKFEESAGEMSEEFEPTGAGAAAKPKGKK